MDDSHFHLFLNNIESDDLELYEVVAAPLDGIVRGEIKEADVARIYLKEMPRRIETEASDSVQLFVYHYRHFVYFLGLIVIDDDDGRNSVVQLIDFFVFLAYYHMLRMYMMNSLMSLSSRHEEKVDGVVVFDDVKGWVSRTPSLTSLDYGGVFAYPTIVATYPNRSMW